MQPTRRKSLHEATCVEIKALAWQQLAERGVSALSLGEIARQLGVTPPALYRYYKNRDALILELIRDANASFHTALTAALNNLADSHFASQFRELCFAYRGWALLHPEQYRLIFENQITDFELDAETGKYADQNFFLLLELIQRAAQAGELGGLFNQDFLTPTIKQQLASIKHPQRGFNEKETYLALACWSFIHGFTSLELNQRYRLLLAGQAQEFLNLEINRFLADWQPD